MTSYNNESVTVKHHSTSSVVEITIETREEDGKGGLVDEVQEIWMDYDSFTHLKEVLSVIDIP